MKQKTCKHCNHFEMPILQALVWVKCFGQQQCRIICFPHHPKAQMVKVEICERTFPAYKLHFGEGTIPAPLGSARLGPAFWLPHSPGSVACEDRAFFSPEGFSRRGSFRGSLDSDTKLAPTFSTSTSFKGLLYVPYDLFGVEWICYVP